MLILYKYNNILPD